MKMDELKRFIGKFRNADLLETIKHLTHYFNASIANKALGFISIPIFTKLMSTEDYGMLNVYNSYVSIFAVVLTLNAYTSVSRYFYEDDNDLAGFLGTTVIFSGACLLVSTLLFFIFRHSIAKLTGIPDLLLTIIIPQVVFILTSSLFSQIMQCEKNSKLVAVTSIVQNYSGFIISVLFVYMMTDNRYIGYIYGTLIAAGLMSGYFVLRLRSYIRLSFKKEHIIYILKYSLPLIPYVLGASILAQFDRVMINNLNGQSQAGLYSLAYNISMLVPVFLGALQSAIYPDFFKFVSERQYDRIFSLDKKLYSIVLVFCLGFIYFGYELAYFLADAKFHSAFPIIPIIVMSYVFLAISNVYFRYLSFEKRTGCMALSYIIPGIINILLNYYYLPILGYQAGAYTTLASYFFMMLLTYSISKLTIRSISIMPIRMFLPGTVFFFIFAAGFYIIQSMQLHGIFLVLLKSIMLLGFVTTIFWRNVKVHLYS